MRRLLWPIVPMALLIVSCTMVKIAVYDETPAKVKVAEMEALRKLPPEALAEIKTLIEETNARVEAMKESKPSTEWANMMPDIIDAFMSGISSIIGKFTEPGTENLKEIFVSFFEESGKTLRAWQQFRTDVVNRSIEVSLINTSDDAAIDVSIGVTPDGAKSVQIGRGLKAETEKGEEQ